MDKNDPSRNGYSPAFTIVELLVVIVVIGILASITIVSYTGISKKATVAAIQSDLANASKQLKIYQATYGSYPTALDANKCPTAPTADTTLCLKASSINIYTYTSDGTTFALTETGANSTVYNVTDSTSPAVGAASALNPADWLTIGTQTWAKANLNVGTRIASATDQTNNSTVEKYCYNNDENNCTAYGGLYQWDEAMQYTNTEGAQGICPTGSHIPTDNDWKILEMQLGMTQIEADKSSAWRGTDQGAQLKPGGTSGLNLPLAGNRDTGGSFNSLSSDGVLWSSSKYSPIAWSRSLVSGRATVYRDSGGWAFGFSVRCLGN